MNTSQVESSIQPYQDRFNDLATKYEAGDIVHGDLWDLLHALKVCPCDTLEEIAQKKRLLHALLHALDSPVSSVFEVGKQLQEDEVFVVTHNPTGVIH
ncbi:MAG: hypothetical protein ABJH63_10610 [Rhizobiaceae bacterium]